MVREDIFVTPIWHFDFSQIIDNAKLEHHAKQLREKFPEKRNPEGYQTVNLLKWKSYDLGTADIMGTPELKKLVELVNESVDKCFLDMNPRENAKLKVSDIWYNIYDTGASLESHPHPGNCISATYYIKTSKDCGDFVCGTPDRTIQYQYSPKYFSNRNAITREKHFIPPKEGGLVCIPSSLMHWVTTNRSDSERISISFNYKVVDSNPFPPNHKLFKP